MAKIKDIDPETVESTMNAISSVIKAIIVVAKCVNNFKQTGDKVELSKGSAV